MWMVKTSASSAISDVENAILGPLHSLSPCLSLILSVAHYFNLFYHITLANGQTCHAKMIHSDLL